MMRGAVPLSEHREKRIRGARIATIDIPQITSIIRITD